MTSTSTTDSEQKDSMDVARGSGSPESIEDRDLYNPYAEKSVTNNTALLVQGHKLYVSKAVLSLVSPVFRSMFELDMEEKNMDEIPLPGKCLDDMVEFLECVYPNTRRTITEDNAESLVPLFDEYQLDDQKKRCEEVLVEASTKDSDIYMIFDRLLVATTYNMEELKNKCIQLAALQPCSTLHQLQADFSLAPELTSELWEIAANQKDADIRSLVSMCKWAESKTAACTYSSVQDTTSVTSTAQRKIMRTQAVRTVYTTAIKTAIKYNLNKTVELLSSMYLGELIGMEDNKYTELLKSDLPESVKSDILKRLEANSKK